ncbi:hypothetical protein RGQ29_008272 [Quercus rubra]|uniref:Uncharacterized protein n=2 Tax=Quercus TaxID=3511 RepID=A0AAN7I4Z5_QUERU|nr:hypothetical protein RGQ29_008272 [Quercus rubra]POE96750.1 hypothetical protein CFP56_27416 [Quercus suber]
MATEKANAEVSQTPSSSTQDNSTDQSENSKQSATPYFGKALAHRALYGSGSRSSGSRKVRTNDVKSLPSRLSKVSLAEGGTKN